MNRLFANKSGNIFILNEVWNDDVDSSKLTLSDYIDDLTSDEDFEIEIFDYKITNVDDKIIVNSEENPYDIEEDCLIAYHMGKTYKIPLNTRGFKNSKNSSFDWTDSNGNTHQIIFWN